MLLRRGHRCRANFSSTTGTLTLTGAADAWEVTADVAFEEQWPNTAGGDVAIAGSGTTSICDVRSYGYSYPTD